MMEPVANWLGSLAFLEILEYLGKLAVLVVLLFWLFEIPDRLRLEHSEAWRVITTAQGQRGTGGRIDALENLYETGPLEKYFGHQQSLVSLTADNAYLAGIDLYDEHDNGLFDVEEGGAELDSASLQQADLAGADLRQSSLWSARLRGVYLGPAYDDESGKISSTSNLGGAYLEEADLREANLNRANLTGAYLSEANLSDATLYRTVLQGSCLWNTTLEGANLRNANLQNANPPTIRNGDKEIGCYGDYANFRKANLAGVNFQGANLQGAVFTDANVRGADFSKAEGLEQWQIDNAIGDSKTKLPGNLEPPLWWEDAAPPLKEAPLSGSFSTGLFAPTLGFEVGKGWEVTSAETETDLTISRQGAFSISFLNVDEVYDPQNPTNPQDPMEDNLKPAPGDLVGWLKGHPHLDVTNEDKVIVGGITGTQLDVSVPHVPENYPPDCDGPCVPIFANPAASYYYPEEGYRFIVLPIGGETVVIFIDSLNEENLQEAHDVLDTLEWSNYELAPGQEFSSGLFEPDLAFTASQRWTDFGQGSDWWQIGREEPTFSTFSFTNVDEVRNPQDPTNKYKARSAPDDLVGWLKGHPHLDVTNEDKVIVGGITGTQLDVSVLPSAPEKYLSSCGDPCLPLFQMNDGSPFWLYNNYENQLIVLRVGSERVIISIESPDNTLDQFSQEVHEALSTVNWRGCSSCQVPEGPQTASPAGPSTHSSHSS